LKTRRQRGGFFLYFKKMKVVKVEECYLTNGKAAYSKISEGLILVNRNVFSQLNKYERTFVLLHEAGHIELETADECKADAYAYSEYVKLGFPVSQILTAMDKVLTNKPQNSERKSIMKQLVSQTKLQSVDGAPTGWGDWLSWGAAALGLGSKIAGGTAAEKEAADAEAKALEADANNKKTIAYILAGLALVAVVVLIFIYKKK
jgi:hypothetical protein